MLAAVWAGQASNKLMQISFCIHSRSDDIRSANVALNNSFRKVFNSFWRECKTVTDVLLVLTSLCFNTTPTSFVVLEKMCIFR